MAAFPLIGQAQKPGKTAEKAKSGTPKATAAPSAPAAEPTEKDKAASTEDADDQEQVATPASQATKESTAEVFKDPKVVELLEKKFQPLAGASPSLQMKKQVQEMYGGTPINRDILAKYVTGLAADLTNPQYIRAFMEQGAAGGNAGRGMRDAIKSLLDPVDAAKRSQNAEFLHAYSQELLKVFPRVLENHPVSRIQAMVVLGQTGSPDAVDVFAQQLNNKNQIIWVKLWAARGITNIVQSSAGNRVDEVLSGRAIPAAKALTNFLNRETDTPWPVQLRALEALGALRLAADPAASSKVEMADAAVRQLANREAKPEVRAQAAWALGMMRLGNINQFNYPLVAYLIGDLAADVGERVAASYGENLSRAEYWAAVLVYQIFPALYGQDGIRDSGLKTQGAGPNRAVNQLADLVRPLVKTSVDLLKSPPGGRAQVAKDLNERVGQLRAYLDKNRPSNTFLVPQGNQFPLQADVAGAPGQPARVAGGGR